MPSIISGAETLMAASQMVSVAASSGDVLSICGSLACKLRRGNNELRIEINAPMLAGDVKMHGVYRYDGAIMCGRCACLCSARYG